MAIHAFPNQVVSVDGDGKAFIYGWSDTESDYKGREHADGGY